MKDGQKNKNEMKAERMQARKRGLKLNVRKDEGWVGWRGRGGGGGGTKTKMTKEINKEEMGLVTF